MAACTQPRPCRRVIAHHHCQNVATLYFVGNFHGSRAALPRNTTDFELVMQCFLQMFVLWWLPSRRIGPFQAPRFLFGPCRPYVPTSSRNLKDADEDLQLGELNTTEVDEDYYAELSAIAARNVEQDESKTKQRRNRLLWSLLAVPHSVTSPKYYGKHSSWWAFWAIPKVRYYLAIASSFVYWTLLVVMLVCPVSTQDLDGPGPMPPIRIRGARYTAVEVTYWIFTLGILVEHLTVAFRGRLRRYVYERLFSPDFWMLLSNLVAFGCRMKVLSFQLSEYTSCEEVEASFQDLNCEQLSLHLGVIGHVELDALVIAMIIGVLRFLKELTYFPSVGMVCAKAPLSDLVWLVNCLLLTDGTLLPACLAGSFGSSSPA